jgi:hypothetical protein
VIQSQILPTLTYLRRAVANLSSARLTSPDNDPTTTFSIDQLLREVLAQIRRLEKLYPPTS